MAPKCKQVRCKKKYYVFDYITFDFLKMNEWHMIIDMDFKELLYNIQYMNMHVCVCVCVYVYICGIYFF